MADPLKWVHKIVCAPSSSESFTYGADGVMKGEARVTNIGELLEEEGRELPCDLVEKRVLRRDDVLEADGVEGTGKVQGFVKMFKAGHGSIARREEGQFCAPVNRLRQLRKGYRPVVSRKRGVVGTGDAIGSVSGEVEPRVARNKRQYAITRGAAVLKASYRDCCQPIDLVEFGRYTGK